MFSKTSPLLVREGFTGAKVHKIMQINENSWKYSTFYVKKHKDV